MKSNTLHYATIVLLSGLMAGLGFFTSQTHFWPLCILYLSYFAIYLVLLTAVHEQSSIRNFVLLGMLLRGMLLFSFPNWSDDVYRFIWDGRLLTNGINPFLYPPSHYMKMASPPAGLTAALYAKLNSPIYNSIYPPVSQAIFWMASAVFPKSIYGAMIVMKLWLLAAEFGNLLLIQKILRFLKLPPQRILIFALNPLLIMEIMGNLHFEGIMLFFVLLSLYLLLYQRNLISGFTWALAIGVKLVPLLFMPLMIPALGWPRKSIGFFAVVGSFLVLIFLPFFSTSFVPGFSSSLDLYFQKFEFNASVYYVLRWLGIIASSYNLILFLGPILAIAVFELVIKLAMRMPKLDLPSLFVPMLFSSASYLFLSTIVHPWYVSLPLVLSIFTNYRFVVIWSGLVVFSYSHYIGGVYLEKYVWIALEYIPVFLFFWLEWRGLKTQKINWPLFGE